MFRVRFPFSLLCTLLMAATLSACGGGGGGGGGGSTGGSSNTPGVGTGGTDGGGGGADSGGDDTDDSSQGGSDKTTTTPKVAAGGDFSLALKADGSLWGWGASSAGQLAQGEGVHSIYRSPIRIGTDSDWVDIATGNHLTLALKSDGTLWFAGTADSLGPFTYVLTRIGTDKDWSRVVAGANHVLALKSNGTLWAWGNNAYGQLGVGDNERRTTPTQIGTDTDWIEIAAGEAHSFGIKSDHSLWAWGSNKWGQLGLGDTVDRNVPTRVGGAVDWSTVSGGYRHSLAIKSDGSLWAWGSNGLGQLGNGALAEDLGMSPPVLTPTQIDDATSWSSVVAGRHESFGIGSDGTLWAWGFNQFADLGLGAQGLYTAPTQVGTDSTWVSVAHGTAIEASHTVALKSDDSRWSWGDNGSGQLGVGDVAQRETPTKIPETPPSNIGGGSSCLVGTWKTPTCGGTKQQTLLFNSNGSGAFTNPDCNDICNPLVFNFNYSVNGSSVTLHYGVPAPVECTGYGSQQPPKPNDDTFTYTCAANQLTTTTALGTTVYTK